MKPEEKERLAEQWLETGLKGLGQAEPRVGLEARILANLRTEPSGRNWSWWPGVVALVAVLVILAMVTLKQTPPAVLTVAHPISKAGQRVATQSDTSAHSPGEKVGTVPRRVTRSAQASRGEKAEMREKTPRLEEFPSPQPLSEQEKLLARYVDESPQEAAVVAKMRAELLQQDLLEFERRHAAPEESQDRKQ